MHSLQVIKHLNDEAVERFQARVADAGRFRANVERATGSLPEVVKRDTDDTRAIGAGSSN
jgi:hypothetical protein